MAVNIKNLCNCKGFLLFLNMRILINLLLIIIVLLCQSCFAPHEAIKSNYTQLNPQTIVNPKQPIVLFFENEPINYEYQKLGLVEVQGTQFTNTEDNLNHLKYEAWQNGANALINIKNTNKLIQTRVSSSSTLAPTFHNVTVTSAMAVRINDSLYHKLIPNKTDTLYFSKVSSYNKSETTGLVARLVLGTLCVIACIVIAIYYSKPK